MTQILLFFQSRTVWLLWPRRSATAALYARRKISRTQRRARQRRKSPSSCRKRSVTWRTLSSNLHETITRILGRLSGWLITELLRPKSASTKSLQSLFSQKWIARTESTPSRPKSLSRQRAWASILTSRPSNLESKNFWQIWNQQLRTSSQSICTLTCSSSSTASSRTHRHVSA